jgi:cysteine desulfurase / selenocysteine lyase
MSEITSELIAAITNRLFNEIPGANLDSTDALTAVLRPSRVVEIAPDISQLPGQLLETLPSGSGVVGWPDGYTGIYAEKESSRVTKEMVPAHRGEPATPEDNYDGLRSFVAGIRSMQSDSTGEHCLDQAGQDDIQRLFAGKSVPTGGLRPLDIPAIRRDFPALNQQVHGRPLAWLDNAATPQKPQAVIDALSSFYAHDNSNIHRGAHTLAARATDAFEEARKKVQTFLGASSANEIVFVRGTTEGINLVAQSYGWKFLQPGDEIILSTLEHHANIVPWQMVAKEKGAILWVIPVTDRGEIMLEEYQRLLGARTKLVALTHASNSLGTILPVAEMTQWPNGTAPAC